MQRPIQSVAVISSILIMLCTSSTVAQTPVGYQKQIFVMKQLIPSMKSVAVISSKVTTELNNSIKRAGLGLGIHVIVAKVNSPREIPEVYKILLKSEIKIIWLPDKDDAMLLDLGFEYLRETALEDKIGLCVPISTMVPEGALCCIQIEEGKIVVYINKKIAQVIGANVPEDSNGSVRYILK
jgi:ABC-type uncharacterized transport system substrate-binding protein